MPKEATNNQNQTFIEQDACIVINRKLQDAGWILEGPDKNVLTVSNIPKLDSWITSC